MKLLAVVAIVMAVTLPFGFYRARVRKFSLRWFLAIHLPVPLVFLTRFEAHLPYTYIPLTCLAFFCAQFLGGVAAHRWAKRRVRRGAGGYPPAEGSSRGTIRGS